MGKFHGVINPQTPRGLRTVMQNLLGSSEVVVCPNSLPPFAGHVKRHVDGFLHVAPCLLQHLAHFARHGNCKVLLVFLEQGGGAIEDFSALGRRRVLPRFVGLFGRSDGCVHVFGSGFLEISD